MEKRSIVIDCRGQEGDFQAIKATLAAPESLSLLGITTTGPATQEIAERVPVEVFGGCGGTLWSPFSQPFPSPSLAASNPLHGVDFLIQTLLHTSEKITLLALGPLTNIALALVRDPRIRQNIQEIVMVGGAVCEGDGTPAAERHFHADPFAASIVLSSHVALTLLTADLTPHRSLRPSLAVTYLLIPSFFIGPRKVFVSVSCEEGILQGYTCVDWWGQLGLTPQVTVFEAVKGELYG